MMASPWDVPNLIYPSLKENQGPLPIPLSLLVEEFPLRTTFATVLLYWTTKRTIQAKWQVPVPETAVACRPHCLIIMLRKMMRHLWSTKVINRRIRSSSNHSQWGSRKNSRKNRKRGMMKVVNTIKNMNLKLIVKLGKSWNRPTMFNGRMIEALSWTTFILWIAGIRIS